MTFCKYCLLIISVPIVICCSSPNDDVIGEEHAKEGSSEGTEGAYMEECKWIYSQMNRHYLWRQDMPDSVSCNYTTDPVTFFKSLLSPKDRFSYCERNTDYTRSQNIKNDEDDYTVVLTRSTSENVLIDTVYYINNKKIGYFCYLKFEGSAELAPIIKKFKEANVDELIIDLRYNPGGYVNTCKYLCNSLVNESAYGKIFQSQGFNDILSHEMLVRYGRDMEDDYFDFPSDDNKHILGLPLYGLNMGRLYVLTSRYTASASEALIVCLRPYNDVIVIGEKTVGKGVGSYIISDSKYKYMLHPITLRYYNANIESTPDDGINPNYIVENGYETKKREIGNTEEPLLQKAISLISNHSENKE